VTEAIAGCADDGQCPAVSLFVPDMEALMDLSAQAKATGGRSGKISARVDARVLAATAERLGMAGSDVSDVVNAAWSDPDNKLPDDFEPAM
jgi:hypothetical protein